MTTKVSVVIPVWNPGRNIDRCIDSLLAQTLPVSDFEVLFMDDGSTDGTEARLDELCDTYQHFTVHHLENSGWPGKPRNVGIDRASGEYVQFMDNDDALGAEALDRMYSIGRDNDSDIVIGKVVSDFRGVPHQVFRRTRERCTVRDAPLFDSLTPHKMFRRQFLLDNAIRYPEGKRRLEDQLIMARAYFPAKNVSIVGDYICYYYLKADSGSNAGSARIEPRGYYENLREVLDVVAANTEPGEFRNSILRRFYRGEMLGRVGPPAILRYPPSYAQELVEEVQRLALEPRFDDGVHEGLLALLRVRSYLVRQRRFADLLTAGKRTEQVKIDARLESMRWEQGELVLSLRSWFTYLNEPLELVRRDGRLYLSAELGLDIPAEERECTGQPAKVLADVVIRGRDCPDEFFLPADLRYTETVTAESGGVETVRGEWVGEARVDPMRAFGGRPVPRGVWDISVRLAGLGTSRTLRIGKKRASSLPTVPRPAVLGSPPVIAIPYWTTPHGNLSIDIGQSVKPLTAALPPKRSQLKFTTVAGGRRRLRLTLPITVDSASSFDGSVRLIHRASGIRRELDTCVTPDHAGLSITAALPSRSGASGERLTAGVWDIAMTLPELGWLQPTRCGLVLSVSKRGNVRAHIAPDTSNRPVWQASIDPRVWGRQLVRRGRDRVEAALRQM